jgi:hypothetical protein
VSGSSPICITSGLAGVEVESGPEASGSCHRVPILGIIQIAGEDTGGN